MTKGNISSFLEITPDRVLAMVERTGAKATGRVLQLNSMENRVFEVEIECDDPKTKYDQFRVVKFLRPGRWSLASVKEEHDFLKELVLNEVPVAAPLLFQNGKTIEIDPESGILGVVYPRIGGRSPDELSKDDYLKIGRLIGRMHVVGKSLVTNHRPNLDPTTYGVENVEWLYKHKMIPMEIENQYLDVAYEAIELSEDLFEGVTLQAIHGDCHLGNVLSGSAGLFFVDFDDMVKGPVVQDFWLLVSGTDDYGKQQMKWLLEGYEDMARLDREQLRLMEVLRFLRYVHYSTWIAKRWSDPAFPRSFPQFGTHDYWLGQLRDLGEQLRVIKEIVH
jgi:Ser/Thr protein kinase RdoA (MazF antagonist)